MPSILELIRVTPETALFNYRPGVYYSMPGSFTLASYWTDIFEAPTEEEDITRIRSFYVNRSTSYEEVFSLADSLDEEETFYWDNDNQVLYVHFTIDVGVWFDYLTYGTARRFCTGETLYIDDEEYIPSLLSAPSIAQEEDLVDYDSLNFISGSFSLDNSNQDFEFMITENVIGTDAFYSYIPKGSESSDDLVRLGTFYVEDYTIGLNEASIDVQDRREAGNLQIPTEKLSDDDYPNIDPEIVSDIIPLIFGIPREAPAICVNSELDEGDVEYVVASDMTSLGTVQVEIDDVWTTIEPTNVDLEKGEFTIPETLNSASGASISSSDDDYVKITSSGAFDGVLVDQSVYCEFSSDTYDDGTYTVEEVDDDGDYIVISTSYSSSTPTVDCFVYNGGRTSSGSLREVKLLLPEGIPIEKTTDIIHIIADRYEDVPFDSDSYDLDEWECVSHLQSTGSYMLTDQEYIYDIIKDVQNGSKRRFRFEYKADGKRTLLLNDDGKLPTGIIYSVDYDDLEIYTDSDLIYSGVDIEYDKSYYSDGTYTEENTDYYDIVTGDYKQDRTLEIDSLMTEQEDAEFKASSDAGRFSEVPRLVDLTLKGDYFLDIRIYDIFNIELTKGFTNYDTQEVEGREFYGFKRCKVLSIDPDADTETNTVKFQILGDVDVEEYYFLVDENGLYLRDELGNYLKTFDPDTYRQFLLDENENYLTDENGNMLMSKLN